MQKKREIDWSQWYLFAIGVVVVEAVSIYLLMKAYPGEEMKMMGWAILILVIGFSGYATYKADEPDRGVRQVGLIGKCVLALLGVAALWGHSSMSRELSASREAKVEYDKKLNLKNQYEDAKVRRDLAIKQAETDQIAAQTALEKAESRKLSLLPTSQRQIGQQPKPGTTKPPVGGQQSSATPLGEDAAALVPQLPAEPRLEAAVREDWLSFFQWVNFLQILCSVLGALGVNIMRHWDKSGIIGVPDWIERVWLSGAQGQRYVRTYYPQYVQLLENAGAMPLGNSMA